MLFEAAQQLSRARNEITALDLQKEGNAVRLEKLSAEKIQLEEERSGLEARLRQFSATVEEEILNAQTHRGTVEDRQRRLREIQQQLGETTGQLDDLLRRQAENRNRAWACWSSCRPGTKASAPAPSPPSRRPANVLGSLADKIRVPDPYVVAIETALGHHLQLVLTEQPETARQIVEDLRANKTGRASVAALRLAALNGDAPGAPRRTTAAFPPARWTPSA